VNNFDARMSVAKIFGGQKKTFLRVFKTSKSQQSSSQGGKKIILSTDEDLHFAFAFAW
jgi:hypothetical protein